MNKKAFWKMTSFCCAFLYIAFCIFAADADPFNWAEPARFVYVVLNGFAIFMSAIISGDL